MDPSQRRNLLVAGVALLTLPIGLHAQQRERVYRIGFIGNAPLTNPDSAPLNRIFVQALRGRGYDEGTNLVIERRFVEGRAERYPEFAAEMVRLKVDVIVVGSGPGVQAAKAATATIPIVMNGASDPVAAGVISSLAHPGGNVTGVADLQVDLIPKRLELLKAADPKIARVVFLHAQFAGYSPSRAAADDQERATLAQRLGVTLLPIEMLSPQDLETAFASMIRQRPDALLLSPNPTNYIVRKELAEFALKQRLPTIGGTKEMAAAGVLMSYGLDYGDQLRKIAAFIDRILKGANPGDLPVEQPTKFDLVLNLKTAKLLGLSFSQLLLQRADEKIE
jgi:putative tryptophan/tyrosine transport system substrate-binding protein